MTPRRRENGFTLIEALTALFVFSTAAVGLTLMNRDSLSATRLVKEKYLARTVADNVAVDLFTLDERLEIGIESGGAEQLGVAFEWTRTISPSPREGLFIVDISVRRDEDGPILATLSTLKAAP